VNERDVATVRTGSRQPTGGSSTCDCRRLRSRRQRLRSYPRCRLNLHPRDTDRARPREYPGPNEVARASRPWNADYLAMRLSIIRQPISSRRNLVITSPTEHSHKAESLSHAAAALENRDRSNNCSVLRAHTGYAKFSNGGNLYQPLSLGTFKLYLQHNSGVPRQC